MRRSIPEGNPLWREWMRTCRRNPARIVLIDALKDVSWTAEKLTDRALQYSEKLDDFPVGAKIAFRLPNGSDWMALFLALQRANLAAIPLDAAMPKEGCLETARRFGARGLYFEDGMQALQRGSVARGCCCVKVTSGSDGIPKAVACRAEHLLADGRQVVKTMKIRPSDRNLAVIPLGHSYGLGNLVMPLIQQGTAVVTAGEYVPRQLVAWIQRHGVTVLPVVPALLRVLAALPPGPNLAQVRLVISAGAVLSPEIARAFLARFGLKIHNFYGSSETGGITYDRTGNAALTGRSVGKPLEGVSIVLQAGRITVKSAAVAMRGGRSKLGDLAEWNARSELVLLGRLGEEANIGGRKVHPREIERVLRALPGVTDAAVWLDYRGDRDLLAAAVETYRVRDEIERVLAEKLPAWKLPKRFLFARELPRTSRGKLEMAELKRRLG